MLSVATCAVTEKLHKDITSNLNFVFMTKTVYRVSNIQFQFLKIILTTTHLLFIFLKMDANKVNEW